MCNTAGEPKSKGKKAKTKAKQSNKRGRSKRFYEGETNTHSNYGRVTPSGRIVPWG